VGRASRTNREGDPVITDYFFDYFTFAVTCWAIVVTYLLLHVIDQREDAWRAVEDARARIRFHQCVTTANECNESNPIPVTRKRWNGRRRQW
jgi:hypothetical protein